IGWAVETLRDLKMPSDDMIVILGTDDPEVVHRHLDLHRELLEERLDEQRQALVRLERILTDAILERRYGAMCGSGSTTRRWDRRRGTSSATGSPAPPAERARGARSRRPPPR